jgi:hypothetical protein
MKDKHVAMLAVFGVVLVLAVLVLTKNVIPRFVSSEKGREYESGSMNDAPEMMEYSDTANDLHFSYTSSSSILTDTGGRGIVAISDIRHPDLLTAYVRVHNGYETYQWKGLTNDVFAYDRTIKEWRYYDSRTKEDLHNVTFGTTAEGDPVYRVATGSAGNFATTYIVPQKEKNRIVTIEFSYDQANEDIVDETEAFKDELARIASTMK